MPLYAVYLAALPAVAFLATVITHSITRAQPHPTDTCPTPNWTRRTTATAAVVAALSAFVACVAAGSDAPPQCPGLGTIGGGPCLPDPSHPVTWTVAGPALTVAAMATVIGGAVTVRSYRHIPAHLKSTPRQAVPARSATNTSLEETS